MMKKYILAAYILLISTNVFSQILINEFVASNKSYMDSKYKKYSDWIEIYNSGSETINIGGYFLSDDRSNSKKWAIPSGTNIAANGFLIIWSDDNNTGLHTNFNLSINGEFIGIADKSGKYIDSLKYPQQKTDISYGRTQDGSPKWGFFNKPTPNATNNTSDVDIKTEKPAFSIPGGIYNGSQKVKIIAETGAVIHFTTNGAHPTTLSPVYTDSVLLTETTVLKAIAEIQGEMLSEIESATYFINERTFTLPILSISTDSNWIFQPDTGIYELGPNAEAADPHYGANYWLDKEIPMTFQLYSPTGKEYVNEETGAKIYGGYSRMHPVKSMQFKCKSKYGASNFDYKFFKAKDLKEYKNIAIRNSGNDYGVTMFRDALMQQLTKKYMDIDYQETRQVSMFLNGRYFGLTMLIEKINENYIAINHNIDPDSIDLLDGYKTVLNGDNVEWYKFEKFYTNNDLSIQSNYEKMLTMMDMDEYMDYVIAEIYYANTDWPVNNMKFWRKKGPNGKWRWIIYDTDFGFGIWDYTPCDNSLANATATDGSDWPNPPVSTLLLRKLLANQTFKQNFVQRFAYHMNTSFEPNRVKNMIDSMKTEIAPEMPFQINRWQTPGSIDDWQWNVEKMVQFAQERPSCMQSHLQDYFSLSGMNSLTISHDTTVGNVFLAEKKLPRLHSGTYFKNMNISISAVPKPGYSFLYWDKKENSSNNSSITILPARSTWKYLDDGSNQGENWTTSSFNDAQWKSGTGVFGYNENNITTTINYGSDDKNKFITTYFRKQVIISNPQELTKITLRLMRGDGAIVYINGNRLINSNMPSSEINYLTLASGADDASEISYTNYSISSSDLINGNNIIAVEVHQTNVQSSDLSFDMEIIAEKPQLSYSQSTVDYNKDLQLQFKDYDIELTAVFKPSPILETIKELKDVYAYPVPMTDMLNIAGEMVNPKIIVYDIQGQKMISTDKQNIDVSKLKTGVYIIDIKAENGSKKILVSKN